jgi:hypothetical protein
VDTGLIIATLVVALATLAVGIYEVRLVRSRFRQEDIAELKCETVRVYENPKAPAGWQMTVTVRNIGGSPANNPWAWDEEPAAKDVVRVWPVGIHDQLEPGQATRIHRDLRNPPDGRARVWLTWDDSRGLQIRDSRFRIER